MSGLSPLFPELLARAALRSAREIPEDGRLLGSKLRITTNHQTSVYCGVEPIERTQEEEK